MSNFNTVTQQTITLKMADQGRSDFYVVFTMSLCALGLKQLSNRTDLILSVHALRSYLKLICEYELHSLPNKKVIGAKDHGKNYIEVRPPLVRHLFRNRLLSTSHVFSIRRQRSVKA